MFQKIIVLFCSGTMGLSFTNPWSYLGWSCPHQDCPNQSWTWRPDYRLVSQGWPRKGQSLLPLYEGQVWPSQLEVSVPALQTHCLLLLPHHCKSYKNSIHKRVGIIFLCYRWSFPQTSCQRSLCLPWTQMPGTTLVAPTKQCTGDQCMGSDGLAAQMKRRRRTPRALLSPTSLLKRAVSQAGSAWVHFLAAGPLSRGVSHLKRILEARGTLSINPNLMLFNITYH